MIRREGSKRTVDLTEFNINIDDLLDVYVGVQKEAGIDTGMVENDIEIDRNGNVHKLPLEKKKSEKTEVCEECQSKCEKRSLDTLPTNRLGRFADLKSPEISDEDEEDDTYICEYCTEIGCSKQFAPYLCETCTACEGCVEYESGDCSGCTYSRYRTGNPYSVELRNRGQSMPMSEDDAELLELLLDDDSSNDRMPIDKGFTVMDYDHKY